MDKNFKNTILVDRSISFAKVREFFHKRSVLEVDTPSLSPYPSFDSHIHLIEAKVCGKKKPFYLHSSPEIAMKALLSEGFCDCYFLGHVFRDLEVGKHHLPEFTMIEWYRLSMGLEAMIEETIEMARLFIECGQVSYLTYHELFTRFVGVDIRRCSDEELIDLAGDRLIGEGWERQTLIDWILTHLIEPLMKGFVVVTGYPSSQAALAKVEGELARRFELYYEGLELANGYFELTDLTEHQKRFDDLDQNPTLVKALSKGLPECSGVAMGFDRLMMAKHKREDILDVIPNAAQWESAGLY